MVPNLSGGSMRPQVPQGTGRNPWVFAEGTGYPRVIPKGLRYP